MADWNHRGHRHHWGRFVEKGDFKYIILDLLKDQPRHGYDIIRALEDRFFGFYSPSAGTVYPTLQMLEDMGYVTSTEQDGKKVYAITDEGRRFVEERKATMDEIRDRMKHFWSPEATQEMHDMIHELKDFGKNIARQARGVDADKLHRIRDVIGKAYRDVEDIVRDRQPL